MSLKSFSVVGAAVLLGSLVAMPVDVRAQSADELQRRSQDELRRQAEREKARETGRPPVNVKLTLPEGSAVAVYVVQESPCFEVRGLELTGPDAAAFPWLPVHQDGRGLLAEPDSLLGRCLGVQGVQQLLARLQNALIARGWITSRVLIEPQSMQGGVLRVAVIRGWVESVAWDPASGRRASRWNTVPVAAGETLNLRDVEQALENYRRVPSAEADIQITPGREPGSSILLVKHRQDFPFRVGVTLDDSGSRSTGRLQSSVTFSYDNWWTLSDMAYVSFSGALGDKEPGSRGNRGATWHYSLPLGYWLLGATLIDGQYHQTVSGLSQDYQYSGVNRTFELKLSKVLHRDTSSKTGGSVKVFRKSSNNFIDDTEVEVQRRVVAGLEWGLTHRQAWETGATLEASVGYRHGTGALQALRAPEERFGEGTARMRLLSAELALQAPLGQAANPVQYSAVWRSQWERTPLVPQDRFAIGGRYTVRGFDGRATLQADRGWLLRQEFSRRVASTLQAYLAVDMGHVIPSSGRPLSGGTLSGAASGLRGQWRGLQFDLFAGVPVRKPQRFEISPFTMGFSLSAGS